MRKILSIIAILLLSLTSYAQQIPIYNHNFINPFLYSPARTGLTEQANVFLLHRNQWQGFSGAPKTSVLTIDAPLEKKKIGMGLILTSDVLHIIEKTSMAGAFSFHTKIAENHKLSFGTSLGLSQYKLNFEKVRAESLSDITIFENTESSTNLDANFGILYRFKEFEFDISTAQLFSTKSKFENQKDFKELIITKIPHYMVSAKYEFYFKEKAFSVSPQMFIRSTQGAAVQYDASAVLNWEKRIWFGLTYRQDYALTALAGVRLYNNLTIGYSYDYLFGEIANHSGGTHEIVIGFHFGKRDYNNNQTGKNRNKYEEIKKISQEQSENIDELTQKNEELYKKLSEQKEEIERLKTIYNRDEKQIEEIIKKYQYISDTSKVTNNETTNDNSSDTAKENDNNNNTKTEKDENIQKKSEGDFYVVVGAYLNVSDVKLLQKILKREIDLNTKIIASENGKYYFVYSDKFEDAKEAQKEISKLYKSGISPLINGKLWIYKP